jgi:hypothetical protein
MLFYFYYSFCQLLCTIILVLPPKLAVESRENGVLAQILTDFFRIKNMIISILCSFTQSTGLANQSFQQLE